jgi:hypothetical protein
MPSTKSSGDVRDSSLLISCMIGKTLCDVADTLGTFVNSDRPLSVPIALRGTFSVLGISDPKPFGRISSTVACGAGYVHAPGGAWSIGVYSADGVLLREITSPDRRRPVTREMMDAWIHGFLRQLPARWRSDVRESLAAYQPPERAPAIERVLCDNSSHIWVEEFAEPASARHFWTILDLRGKPLGRLALPATQEVLSVGADHVLVQTKDADGVPSVAVYRIVR